MLSEDQSKRLKKEFWNKNLEEHTPKMSESHMKLIEPLTKELPCIIPLCIPDMKFQLPELLPEAPTTTHPPDTRPLLPELPGEATNNVQEPSQVNKPD